MSGKRINTTSRQLGWTLLFGAVILLGVLVFNQRRTSQSSSEAPVWLRSPAFSLVSPWDLAATPESAGPRRYPLGNPLGAFSYNARSFLEARHLGDDWNGIGGWNSDQGDPVFAVATGRVVYTLGNAADSWGGRVMVAHREENGLVYSFYGHLESIHVATGETVFPGDTVGTVGTANGNYLAHLHLEIRTSPTIWSGQGYASAALDRLNPESWIREKRPLSDEISLLLGDSGWRKDGGVRFSPN